MSRSQWWSYYDKVGANSAKCRKCSKILKAKYTNNLRKHILFVHAEKFSDNNTEPEKPPTAVPAISPGTSPDKVTNRTVFPPYVLEEEICFRILHSTTNTTTTESREVNPPWNSLFNSPSILAIELGITEWQRRAILNGITVSRTLIRRWSRFAGDYIGYDCKQKTFWIWLDYFSEKHNLAAVIQQHQNSVQRTTSFSASNPIESMNFFIIFHELCMDFGCNIMYPEGGLCSDDETPKRFLEPGYISMELILTEWLNYILLQNEAISSDLLLEVANQAADCIGFDQFYDPQLFIMKFKSKYRNQLEGNPRIMDVDEDGIHKAIKEACKRFGTDIIYPKGRCDLKAPSKKRKTSDIDWGQSGPIIDAPSYIALELVLREWIERVEYNRTELTPNLMRSVMEQFAQHLAIRFSARTDNWYGKFKERYNISFESSAKGQSSNAPAEPKSTVVEDIINDLRKQYGQSVIIQLSYGYPCLIGDPEIGHSVRQWHEALILIVGEWVERCRHNHFMITAYNLTELVKSIAGYLQCRNDELINQWVKFVKLKYQRDMQTIPNMFCPLGHKYKLTNVYVIIQDLCKIYGKSRILPLWDHSSIFNLPENACSLELQTDQNSINKAPDKSQQFEPRNMDGSSGGLFKSPGSFSFQSESNHSMATGTAKVASTDSPPVLFETEELIIKQEDCNELQDDRGLSCQAEETVFDVPQTEDDHSKADDEMTNLSSAEMPPKIVVPIPENVNDGNVCLHKKPISSYEDAIQYMKCVEHFLLENEDMRAVGLLNQLENVMKNRNN